MALGDGSKQFTCRTSGKCLFPANSRGLRRIPHSNYTAYEYAVLATSLQDEARRIAQHYRDCKDLENNLDELKNQWG